MGGKGRHKEKCLLSCGKTYLCNDQPDVWNGYIYCKQIIGHVNLRHTEIYAKIVDEKKRQEIQKLPTL